MSRSSSSERRRSGHVRAGTSSSSSKRQQHVHRKSGSRSSSAEYYYCEEVVHTKHIDRLWEDPHVVGVRRIGHSHVHRNGSSSSSKKKRRSSSSSSSSKGGCCLPFGLCCCIPWLLALLLLALFITFLSLWLAKGDADADIIITTEMPEIEDPDFYPGWPIIEVPDAWDPDVEAGFINNIVGRTDFTLSEKVAQLIMPTIGADVMTGLNVGGPSIVRRTNAAGAPTAALHLNIDYMDKIFPYNLQTCNTPLCDVYEAYPCEDCAGTKSQPRAITRLLEQAHVRNEDYWTLKPGPTVEDNWASCALPIPDETVDVNDPDYVAPVREECDKLRIPLMTAADLGHGMMYLEGGMLYPQPVGVGSGGIEGAALGAMAAKNTATTLNNMGFDWVFGPSAITPRYETSGMVYEGFSEEPTICAAHVAAQVAAIQGAGFDEVAVAVKEFGGEGGSYQGFTHTANYYDEQQFINIHNFAAISGIAAGAMSIQVSDTAWSSANNYDMAGTFGEYAGEIAGSKYLLTDILREKMGFSGVIVTKGDSYAKLANTPALAAAMAIKAGVTMFQTELDPSLLHAAILGEAQKDQELADKIDEAVGYNLLMKHRLGLFQKSSPLGVACNKTGIDIETDFSGVVSEWLKPCNAENFTCKFNAAESGSTDGWSLGVADVAGIAVEGSCGRDNVEWRADSDNAKQLTISEAEKLTATQLAQQSIVLFKNDDDILPISEGTWNNMTGVVTIGIIGSAAADWSRINGGYSLSRFGTHDGNQVSASDSSFPHELHPTIALINAITEKFPEREFNFVTDCGGGESAQLVNFCIALVSEQSYADVIGDITQFGDISFASSPMTSIDNQLVMDAHENGTSTGMRVVTVYFGGRAYEANQLINASDAYVVAWLPGRMGGTALADLLVNGETFEGTLSRTWPIGKCDFNINMVPANYPDDAFSGAPGEVSYLDLLEDSDKPFPVGFGDDGEVFDGGVIPEDKDPNAKCRGSIDNIEQLDPGFQAGPDAYGTPWAFGDIANMSPPPGCSYTTDGGVFTADCECFKYCKDPTTCAMPDSCPGFVSGGTIQTDASPYGFVMGQKNYWTGANGAGSALYMKKTISTVDGSPVRYTAGSMIVRDVTSGAGNFGDHSAYAAIRGDLLKIDIAEAGAIDGKMGVGFQFYSGSQIWVDLYAQLNTGINTATNAASVTSLCLPIECVDIGSRFNWSQLAGVNFSMNGTNSTLGVVGVGMYPSKDTVPPSGFVSQCTGAINVVCNTISGPFYGQNQWNAYEGKAGTPTIKSVKPNEWKHLL